MRQRKKTTNNPYTLHVGHGSRNDRNFTVIMSIVFLMLCMIIGGGTGILIVLLSSKAQNNNISDNDIIDMRNSNNLIVVINTSTTSTTSTSIPDLIKSLTKNVPTVSRLLTYNDRPYYDDVLRGFIDISNYLINQPLVTDLLVHAYCDKPMLFSGITPADELKKFFFRSLPMIQPQCHNYSKEETTSEPGYYNLVNAYASNDKVENYNNGWRANHINIAQQLVAMNQSIDSLLFMGINIWHESVHLLLYDQDNSIMFQNQNYTDIAIAVEVYLFGDKLLLDPISRRIYLRNNKVFAERSIINNLYNKYKRNEVWTKKDMEFKGTEKIPETKDFGCFPKPTSMKPGRFITFQ